MTHQEIYDAIKAVGNNLNTKINKVMGQIENLIEQVKQLQVDLDAKQGKIDASFKDLEKQNADLKALIETGNGATPEQLQTLSDAIAAISDDLKSTPEA